MSLSKKDGDVLMEKVVLYIGLTDEENKALSTEEIESILSKRTTELLTYTLYRNILIFSAMLV